ncbi:MAG: SoxR reducing system RseC family protein [Prevotellaceae bacterium]|nr:SoxR reducing system RseC family protein [Prevotellaceae bacterium]
MSENRANAAIVHEGVVTSVKGREVEVLIRQTSACAACAAASLCHAAEGRNTVISATCPAGEMPKAGDSVVLEGTVGQGLWATVWAYVVPLVLLVGVLSLGVALLHNEGVAALLAIAVVAVYYVALHFAGKQLRRRLSFEVKSIINVNQTIKEQQ